MTYADQAEALSRTPVSLTVITLDYCGRVFGVAPCTASGEPCYNTFHTCKAKTAYLKGTKDYEFTSSDAPLPFPGPRPYLKAVTLLPTEIGSEMTVKGRLKLDLYDEPDDDIGIDPYVAQRASVQGTYFKKLLARNPNYKGRPVATYDGFIGIDRSEFIQRGLGTIDSIAISKGVVTIEAVDGLKALAKIDIPPKLDIKVVSAIDTAATQITLSTLEGLDAAGYVRIGDEVIQYAALDVPTNRLMTCTRAAFGTAAAEHSANDKVDKCRYFPPTNPFDLLKEILSVDCSLNAGAFDSAAFDYWRDWPGGEVPFSALITESVTAEQLYFEICDVLDCASWVGEDLRITIRRNMPNEPGRAYTLISDAATISNKSPQVDLNDAIRVTRVILYWNKTILAADDQVTSYGRADIGVDPDAEGPNDYNEQVEKIVYCRWISTRYLQEEVVNGYVKDFVLRRMLNLRDARPIITISVELKDAAIRTGDYAIVQTDELQTAAGIPISERYQVVRREPKGASIGLKLQQLANERVCFITPDAAPEYDSAAVADREYGYISDDSGGINDGAGYLIW